jgi:hypothetical protein
MKRPVKQLGLSAAIMLCWSLQAQTINLRAHVPFPFRVGETVMQAGEYEVRDTGGAVVLRDQSSGSAIMALANEDFRRDHPKTGVLEFNRYGATYFLAKIWTANSGQGRALPQSRRERQLAREFGLPQKTGIALERR